MTAGLTIPRARVTRAHAYLLLAAATMTCLLVTLGGTVCITESAAGCPDWPGCFGQIVPPPQRSAVIEYLHRLIAALTSPLIIAAAAVGWANARPIRWVSRPPVLAIPFLLAVIVFGAFAVLRGLPPVLAAIDLGSALVVLALVVTAATVAFARQADPDLPDHLSARSPLARLSLGALAAVFLVYVSGILVAGQGSATRCLGWPMWRLLPNDLPGWPQVARLAISALGALLIAGAVIQAWRERRRGAAAWRVASAVGLVFLVEMVAGVLLLAGGSSLFLLVVYVAAAAALWALLVVLAALAGGAASGKLAGASRG